MFVSYKTLDFGGGFGRRNKRWEKERERDREIEGFTGFLPPNFCLSIHFFLFRRKLKDGNGHEKEQKKDEKK